MKPRFKLADAERAAVKEEMRRLMIEQAKRGETIAYSELSARLETAYLHQRAPLYYELLTEIGREEVAAGRGGLPAVVVRKDNGMPGAGYFAHMPHAEHADLEAYWQEELQIVYDYWRAHS